MKIKITLYLLIICVAILSVCLISQKASTQVLKNEEIKLGQEPLLKSENNIKYEQAFCSWYGPGFHEKQMANGLMYNQSDFNVVAHKSLPFGTIIEFYNSSSEIKAISVVQDRGPYVKGREFDLSKGLASKLNVRGVSLLRYRIIKMGNNKKYHYLYPKLLRSRK